MAPRKRSNRAQRISKSTVARPTQAAHYTARSTSLPDELWLEIASHIPSMPLPTEYLPEDGPELEGYQARHMTFVSLTLTCRSLRRIFMKYLWQRIEVIDGMKSPNGRLPSYAARMKAKHNTRRGFRAKRFTQELLRQLNIVTKRQPSLAEHVRDMNIVFLPRGGPDQALEELAKGAAAFPNLRTVQLIFNDPVPFAYCREILKRYTYPQVTTLSISHPHRGYFRSRGAEEMGLLVASCPGLRRLAPCMNEFCLTSVFDSPHLEVVGPLLFPSRDAKEILKSTKLRDISIHADNFSDFSWKLEYLEPLRKLRHLHTIRIGVHEDTLSRTPEDSMKRLQSWVEYCRRILSDHREHVEGEVCVNKQVIVVFYSASGKPRFETHDV